MVWENALLVEKYLLDNLIAIDYTNHLLFSVWFDIVRDKNFEYFINDEFKLKIINKFINIQLNNI